MIQKISTLAVLTACWIGAVSAEVAVIVHPSNQQAINETYLKNLFTGKQKSFPDGSPAIVLNLPEGDSQQSLFNEKALGKSNAQLKAYWSKVIFTGKGTPPKEVTAAEMLNLVATNPSTIGVIDVSQADKAVRILIQY